MMRYLVALLVSPIIIALGIITFFLGYNITIEHKDDS